MSVVSASISGPVSCGFRCDFHDQKLSRNTLSWRTSLSPPCSILSLPAHVNCPPAAAAACHPSSSCPVWCPSQPPLEPLQLCRCTSLHSAGGAPATVHPAWPHTGPYIDAMQLFPNPALDFDPLPFFIFFYLKCSPQGHFRPGGPLCWFNNLAVPRIIRRLGLRGTITINKGHSWTHFSTSWVILCCSI